MAYPLTNFMIYQKYYQNKSKSKSNGAYSRNASPKIKNGTYSTNLDEYKSIGIHWMTLCLNGVNVRYFDNFVVEYIPKEIKKITSNEKIKTNFYRIQANDLMSRYFCIEFINFMLKSKSLLDYAI